MADPVVLGDAIAELREKLERERQSGGSDQRGGGSK
jgi:hypothetical protein